MARKKAPEAAVILSRRFNARANYRRRRDRKIAVDWIGKEFQYRDITTVRLVSYDPDRHYVTLLDTFLNRKVLDTDQFWMMVRSGQLQLS